MSLTNDILIELEKERFFKKQNELLLHKVKNTASNQLYYLTYGVYIAAILFFLAISAGIFYWSLHHAKSPVTSPQTFIIKTPVIPVKTPQNTTLPTEARLISSPAALPQNTNTAVAAPSLKVPVQESVQDIIDQRYQDAVNLIAQNQISAAISELKSIIRIYPTYQDARLALATLYLKNNDITDAVRLLADGLVLDPGNIPITLLDARALMTEHQNADALRALNTIADSAGNDPAYLDLFASVQEALGNYAKAISLYQTLLTQDPANARWLINLGISFEKNNQKSAALTAYKKAEAAGQLPPELQSYVMRRIHYLSGN